MTLKLLLTLGTTECDRIGVGQILHRNHYHPYFRILTCPLLTGSTKTFNLHIRIHKHIFHGSLNVSQRQQVSFTSHEKFQKQVAANQDINMTLKEGIYSTLPLWQARI